MTNTTKFHSVPASWLLEQGHVIMPMVLTPKELAVLLGRLLEFWTEPGALSVSAENDACSVWPQVRVEYEGEARVALRVTDVVFSFFQDVNNDLISNDEGDEPEVRHTVCKRCGLDVEAWLDGSYKTVDRGGSGCCPNGLDIHEPIL